MLVVSRYGADAVRLYLINSPVVRAEPLAFKELGVLQNLKEIFLPWLNTYRFFVQSVQRAERDEGWVFERDTARSTSILTTNIMDKWIMAALHGLIKFVREEMAAYRLYTVIPRLVNFITQLTNWYVRLNRSRLKGSLGLQDTKCGLSTMYVVLVNLSTLMSPFTPFFAECMYQKLVIPTKEEEKSVHFLMIPEPDLSLIDEEIETRMKHMQEVVTLGRLCRGNDIPLKRPLRELIIVHETEKTLDGIRKLESYIKLELNVKNVTYTTEEEKYCTLKAKGDGQVLGSKLGKKFGVINKKLQAMNHKELSAFQKAGSLEIEGETLTLDEVHMNRQVLVDELKFQAKVGALNITVVLDTFVDQTLIQEQTAREIMNRVQRLRRSSGIQPEDVVDIFYDVKSGDVAEMDAAILNNHDLIIGTLRRQVHSIQKRATHACEIGTSNEEFGDFVVSVSLYWPCVGFASDDVLMTALKATSAAVTSVKTTVASMNLGWLELNAVESLTLIIDGDKYALEAGKHYMLP